MKVQPVARKPVAAPPSAAQPAGSAPSAATPPLAQKPTVAKPAAPKPAPVKATARASDHRSENYYQIKTTIFNALIDTIDLTQLAQLDAESAREEIRDIVNEIICRSRMLCMSISEQEALLAGYLQRCSRLRSARAAAGARRHCRHHGQWLPTRTYHRSQRQGRAVPISASATMQSADEHLPAHRVSQVGRRVDESSSDLRRAPARRFSACQRHRAAAGDRRARAHHS